MPYEIRRSSDKSEQERRMTSPPERLQRSGGYERCEPKKRRQLVVSPFGATASDHDPSRQTRYETSIGDEQLRAETNSGHGESSERGLEWVKYRGFPQGEEAQTEFLRSSFTKVVQPDVMEKSAELAEIATQLDYEIFYSYAKDGMIKSSIFDTSIGYYRSKLRIPSIDDIASKKTASHQTSEGGNRSQLSDNDKIISKLVTLRKNIQELKNFKKSQIGCSAEKYIATILVDTYYIIRRDEEKIPEKAIDFCNNHIKPKLEKIGFLDE